MPWPLGGALEPAGADASLCPQLGALILGSDWGQKKGPHLASARRGEGEREDEGKWEKGRDPWKLPTHRRRRRFIKIELSEVGHELRFN